MPTMDVTYTSAPQEALVRRYQTALAYWAQPGIREAADLIGLSMRLYCDRLLAQLPALLWVTTGGNPPVVDEERAWAEAVRRAGVEEGGEQ
jgi:acetyl esterase/lipase